MTKNIPILLLLIFLGCSVPDPNYKIEDKVKLRSDQHIYTIYNIQPNYGHEKQEYYLRYTDDEGFVHTTTAFENEFWCKDINHKPNKIRLTDSSNEELIEETEKRINDK